MGETADSLGVGALADPSGVVAGGAIVATLLIEASVPVMLLWRRTRYVWVPVAMAFHLLVALDRTHQFFDFSAVLLALFMLFLPPRFAVDVLNAVGRARHIAARILALLAFGAVLLVARGGIEVNAARFSIGWPLWQLVACAVLAGTIVWLLRNRPGAAPAGDLRVSQHCWSSRCWSCSTV